MVLINFNDLNKKIEFIISNNIVKECLNFSETGIFNAKMNFTLLDGGKNNGRFIDKRRTIYNLHT